MRITPAPELRSRCTRLQALMQQEGLDAIIMMQNADLFYFTGTIQQGILYIPATGDPLYFVRKDFGRARMESGLKEIVPLKSPKDLPDLIQGFGIPLPRMIGMEFDVLSVDLFQRISKIFPQASTSSATDLIRRVRAIKSDYEISIIKDCALQIDRVHQRAKEVIKVGMTDLELAAELENCARKQGHPGFARMRTFNGELHFGHTFSGTDSAVPSFGDTPLGGLGISPAVGQGASYRRICANEPIIIDFCGAFDGYLADQTRVFCIGGLPEKLHRAYDDMIRIENRMKEIAKPGISWGAIYDNCHQYACELGYKESFMGNPGAQVSFIGHGVGIEIDEYPFIARGFQDRVLETGMVFAFEPKAVFAGLGAVGIENTFRVADDGIKHITFSSEELVIL